MKKSTLFLFVFMLISSAFAQENKIYDETRDGMAQVKEAIAQAQKEGKYVLCQVGGNWCPWCIRFAKLAESDPTLSEIIKKEFVYIHLNYSRENRNEEAMRFLGNPARFGFPVFVIINDEGKPIHIQNSAYLEKDKSYDIQKVSEFLLNWTKSAVNTLK